MTFEELENSLKREVLPVYMINGGEGYLTNKSLDMIENACHISLKDFNKTIITDSFKGSAKDIVANCENMPFGDSKRIIIVHDYCGKKNESEKKVFVDYFSKPNSSTCLVFFSSTKSDFFDSFSSKVENISCDKLSPIYLKSWLKDKLFQLNLSCDYKTEQKLCDLCSFSITKLDTEINKLFSIKQGGTITDEDLNNYVTKDIEYVIFDLTGAISVRQNDRVYEIIDDMLKNKESAVSIISLIGNHFRRLFFVSRSALSMQELANLLSIKEYAVTKYKEQASHFTQKQLKFIFDTCVNTEALSKTGKMEGKNALYYLLSNILA